MDQITLGDVSITRVWEYYGPVDMTPQTFFPESPQQAWEENSSWLAPHFLDSETQIVNSAIQTWLLRSGGKNILIDTGVGNHKERPYAPVWSHLDTDFLSNLARAGVRADDVDIVVNTHLHIDHVGWNTYLDGRTWVPTFPNATYLMPKTDFDFWNPANGYKPLLGRGNQNVFEDSVAPVHEAGLTLLWGSTPERLGSVSTITLSLLADESGLPRKLISPGQRLLLHAERLDAALQTIGTFLMPMTAAKPQCPADGRGL